MSELQLHNIFIGSLPEIDKRQLLENLKKDLAGDSGIQVADLMSAGADMVKDFRPEQTIFISGDTGELRAASARSIATLGCLPDAGPEENARGTEHTEAAEENTDVDVTMWAEGFEEIGLTFLTRVYERYHGLPWTILVTERCVVKEFSMDYLDALFALYDGEGMTEYIEPLYPYEQEREYQEAYIRYMYGFYGYGMWIVCDRDTGALIGRAGIERREELGGALELGYVIGEPYQRKGYATEVCTAILTYAEEELHEREIYCLIDKSNFLSVHFAQKLGFSFAGIACVNGKVMRKYRKDLQV